MSHRTIAIAAALSALALGSPVITACANPLANNSFNSGVDKYKQGDYQGAISDNNKAIEINPQNASAFVNRGIARELVDDHDGACRDWRKAVDLGNERLPERVNNQC